MIRAIAIGLVVFVTCFVVGAVFGLLLGGIEVFVALGLAVAAGVFTYRRRDLRVAKR